MKYCFGIDVGGTTVKLGLFETDGTLIDKWEIVTRTAEGGKEILPDIASAVRGKMQEKNLGIEEFAGIGIGIPAPVAPDGSVPFTANLGWGYKEVKRELEELSGMKVCVGNDANVAALGEMWQGGGRGNDNVVMVTLGTGVGGGIIVNGKIVGGSHGAGGEIGHICVNYEETEPCGCGNCGCLEQYASATGIVRLANARLHKNEDATVLRDEPVSAKSVFDAVKAGDKVAQEVAEQFGNYLGHALANIVVVSDPSVIVIGGGVSKAGKVLIPYIEKPFRERVFKTCRETKFVLAELGNDAGMYGAAKMVL